MVADCIRQAKLVFVGNLALVVSRYLQDLRNQGHTAFIVDSFLEQLDQIEHIQGLREIPIECIKRRSKGIRVQGG